MIVAGIVAHYLRIDWQDRGLARQVSVSDDSIDLEHAEDGSYHAETTIFRDYHPWVGLCFGTAEPEIPPHSVDAQGKSRPWLRIVGSDGRSWWVQDDGCPSPPPNVAWQIALEWIQFNRKTGLPSAFSGDQLGARAAEWFRDQIAGIA